MAETGSSVIVTNEGNGDLTQLLPRVHIVVASIEKCVPTLEDLNTLLRVLARSATGQDMTAYNTLSTGARRRGDPDGPEEFHVVLVDNGRTEMLGTVFQDMLRCIRCGACLNHCPIYNAVGGHAYGWVYPGPMGAVLTPSLIGVHEAGHLPERVHLLRALRGGLPDAHPAAEDDAALARARIRQPANLAVAAPRAEGLGVLCTAAAALRLAGAPGDGDDGAAWRQARAHLMAAAGARLDRASRPARALGRHVPGAVAGASAAERKKRGRKPGPDTGAKAAE